MSIKTVIDAPAQELSVPISTTEPVAIDPEQIFGVSPASVNALIERAMDHNLSPEVVTQIMSMRRELMAEYARAQFFAALSNFQGQLPPIPRTKKVLNRDGLSTRYTYAPLDVMKASIAPYLRPNGLSYRMVSALPMLNEHQWVEEKCVVYHVAGHSEETIFQVPVLKSEYMTAQQSVMSAATMAARRALRNAFGLLDADDDADGNADFAVLETLVKKFRKHKVTTAQLEKRIGRRLTSFLPVDVEVCQQLLIRLDGGEPKGDVMASNDPLSRRIKNASDKPKQKAPKVTATQVYKMLETAMTTTELVDACAYKDACKTEAQVKKYETLHRLATQRIHAERIKQRKSKTRGKACLEKS